MLPRAFSADFVNTSGLASSSYPNTPRANRSAGELATSVQKLRHAARQAYAATAMIARDFRREKNNGVIGRSQTVGCSGVCCQPGREKGGGECALYQWDQAIVLGQ